MDAVMWAQARDRVTEQGYVVIPDALAPARLEQVRDRVREQAAAEAAAGVAFFDSGGANQRVWCLLNKGDIFRELLRHPVITELLAVLLGESLLLSSLAANIAGPGGRPMGLHSDQKYVPLPQPPYPLVATAIWMLDDFTEANGATRVVPRSHVWSCDPHAQLRPATVAATGPAGGVLVFDGRLWHGTGANRTDSPRHGIVMHFCRPFIRQQDNFSLSLAPDVLRELTPEERALLGFRVWKTLGGVEGPGSGEPFPAGRSPVRALHLDHSGRPT
jgi:ectoine hydroxylase-related dioxygenase (phytanoyl-CoA dioxygenase family)